MSNDNSISNYYLPKGRTGTVGITIATDGAAYLLAAFLQDNIKVKKKQQIKELTKLLNKYYYKYKLIK